MDSLTHPRKYSVVSAINFLLRWISIGYAVCVGMLFVGTAELALGERILVGDFLYPILFGLSFVAWVLMAIQPNRNRLNFAIAPLMLGAILRGIEFLMLDTSVVNFTAGRFNAFVAGGLWSLLAWSLVTVAALTKFGEDWTDRGH